MALTADQITAQNFKDFYGEIRPYLSGQVPTFANAFNRSDLYSTDEKIIGCWTDGRPVYQKVITTSPVSLPANGTVNITTGISNLGQMISAFLMSAEYKTIVPVGFYPPDIFYSTIGATSGTFGGMDTLVIQYTKTTDQAIKVGTGNDYSTDEQIIGTWIDGKPIYQKTFTNLNKTLSNGWQTFVSISNIEALVDCNFHTVSDGGAITDAVDISVSGNDVQIQESDGGQVVYHRTIKTLTIQYTKTTD